MTEQTALARKIGFPLLVLYGLGTILGAGIYVLVGKVAGSAGMLAPLSFIVAAAVAWLTALSYSQLAILFPRSAGEAVYVEEGFNIRGLTLMVGLLIITTGIVSAATLASGFVGYFNILLPIDHATGVIIAVALLTAVAVWGIAESLTIAALVTVVEILGLFVVLYFCGASLTEVPSHFDELFIPVSGMQIAGVLSGAFLAFYAFIGFEDMVNVAEEVKNPEVQMPRAIIWAVVCSTTLYVLIALVSVLTLPVSQLAGSEAPLAELMRKHSDVGVMFIAVISVFAIVNGILIQIIMASRVVYGMSFQYGGPALLHRVHPLTRTPVYATLLVALLIALFALFLPLLSLAKLTSYVVLVVFTLVNLSLWRVRHNSLYRSRITRRCYPLLAATLCASILVFQAFS